MGRINEKSVVDLSVIIPVYNAMPLLERCLDSVFGQTTKYTYEVILVDDGSTDTSVDYIRSRREANLVLHRQANAGPAAARNRGVELAQGRYCAYLDADDYWMDGYVEQTVAFLDAHADCVAVTVGQRYCKMGVEIKKHPAFLNGNVCDMSRVNGVSVYADGWILDDFYRFWRKWEHTCTGSTTMRTTILLGSGGQRTDLRICEDLEFWPYIASYGHWGFVPNVLCVSDGGIIVSQQGWKKYAKRFTNVPMYDVWFRRLRDCLNASQIEEIKPVLNGVICGHSRAMICGGDFRRAYDNLGFIYKDYPSQYPVRISAFGRFPYYVYAFVWRAYQYLKINKGILLRKVRFS